MADRRPESAGPGLGSRLTSVWRELDRDQRIAASGAAVLIFSLVLPWFQQKGIQQVQDLKFPSSPPTTKTVTIVLNGFEAFSWIEAAVLLVGIGIIAMLFARGERRPFHLPGGDGAVIAAGGAWALFLIAYRVLFFKPEHIGLDTGVQWGLLVAVAAAATVTLAGLRIHAANRPEPPNPAAEHDDRGVIAVPAGDEDATQRSSAGGPDAASGAGRQRPPAAEGTQLRFGEIEPAGRATEEEPPAQESAPELDGTVEQQLAIPIDDAPRRRGRRRRDR